MAGLYLGAADWPFTRPVGAIRLLRMNGRFLDDAPHQIP
jgi:hypothetical protein